MTIKGYTRRKFKNEREEMEKIGFIGVGIMGRPMAKNLIDAGYELVIHDINRDAVKGVADYGAETATSPKEIAQQSEIIITMLPNSPDVEEVALGDIIAKKAVCANI